MLVTELPRRQSQLKTPSDGHRSRQTGFDGATYIKSARRFRLAHVFWFRVRVPTCFGFERRALMQTAAGISRKWSLVLGLIVVTIAMFAGPQVWAASDSRDAVVKIVTQIQ